MTSAATSVDDPLLICLALMSKLVGQETHVNTLRAGFAVDNHGHIPDDAYPDVARQHGMQAQWARIGLEQIPPYAYPVILKLRHGQSCVLLSVQETMAEVLRPQTGHEEVIVPMHELAQEYLGKCLMVSALPTRSEGQLVSYKGEAFHWFWGTLWRFKGFYLESMLATVVANLLTLSLVFFTLNVYDRVVPTLAYTSLWTLAIGTSVAIFFEFLMRWVKARLVDLGGRKADTVLNAALLREIMSIRLENRPQSIGIFASSMRDFEALRDFFSSASLVLIADLPFLLLFLVVIGLMGGPLVWVPATAVPLLILVGLWAQRPLMRAMRRNMKETGEKQSVLVESLMNLEILKAHNAEGYLQKRWEQANAATSESFKEIRSLTNLMLGITTWTGQMVSVAMVVMGVYLIGSQQLTLGALIACVILASRVISPLGSIMGLAARYQQARSSLDTLNGLMQRPRDRHSHRRYLVPETIVGNLRAADVSFTYPGESHHQVLQHIHLSLTAGEHMAVLGKVGSGKSTLLRLLAGLYTPQSGHVFIDDIDRAQIDPAELRSKIGYLGQEAQLFMGTLRENLVLNDSWISDETLISVLKKLDLYSLVTHHPKGLDMSLTEAGGGLSGGQRQLLAVARLMVREPRLVFMDEPTSLMDQGTENKVIEVLGEWLNGRTLVLVTHRLQLLTWVNKILVLDQGNTVAMGPRDQVLRQLVQGIPKSPSVSKPASPSTTPSAHESFKDVAQAA
ncbi:MAG: type I secretion system permease/ATPase [Limnohabitans sp.]